MNYDMKEINENIEMLNDGISHWHGILGDIYLNKEKTLCSKFNTPQSPCMGCPVSNYTKLVRCKVAPWLEFKKHMDKDHDHTLGIGAIPAGLIEECDTCQKHCDDMVTLLKEAKKHYIKQVNETVGDLWCIPRIRR